MSEFYIKENKFLKLENSYEALHKAQGMSTNKKNDPREALDGNKGKGKRKGEEKQAKSLKKRRGSIDNKAPFLKYTNYHSLTTPVDHIYAVTDNSLYKQPKSTKGNKSRRDIKKNCAFQKDIGHNIERGMTLKNKIKRLMRGGNFKEFMDEPQMANR